MMISSLPRESNSPPHRPHRRRSGNYPVRLDELPHVDGGRPRSSSKSGDDEQQPPPPLLRLVPPVVLSDPRVRSGRQSTVLQMSDANLSRLLDARGRSPPPAASGMVREAGGRSSMSGSPTSSGNPKLGAPGAERRGSKLFITADTKFRTLKKENNYVVVREGGSEGDGARMARRVVQNAGKAGLSQIGTALGLVRQEKALLLRQMESTRRQMEQMAELMNAARAVYGEGP